MPKAKKPRATKMQVSWQRKRQPKKVVKANRRKAWTPEMKPYVPSEHPLVNFLRPFENGHSPDPDVKQALIAGFQSAHCNPDKFNKEKEIARVKLSDGTTRISYGCDICGFVGHKVTQ